MIDSPSAPTALGQPGVLITARLALRELQIGDAPAVAALVGDPRVARFLIDVPTPYPLAVARRWVASRIDWWETGRGITLAIVRRHSAHELLGTVSLRCHPRDRRAELGYWLATSLWGQGYATEAIRAFVDFGFRELGISRIHAQVMTGNAASKRVLAKLGFANEGLLRQHFLKSRRFCDVALYGLLRDEWSGAPRASGPG